MYGLGSLGFTRSNPMASTSELEEPSLLRCLGVLGSELRTLQLHQVMLSFELFVDENCHNYCLEASSTP